jgi:hypothetical protein
VAFFPHYIDSSHSLSSRIILTFQISVIFLASFRHYIYNGQKSNHSTLSYYWNRLFFHLYRNH